MLRYRWNPVFNLVMEIKHNYNTIFSDNEEKFDVWLEKLNNKKYNDIFECLQTNQSGNLLLIRYGLAEMQSGMWEDKNSIYRECRSVVIDLKNEENEIKEFADGYNVAMTNIENIDLIQVLKQMKEYKSYEKEGWVLNIDGHMVKVKCDDYVHLHRLLDKFSSVNVIIENIAEDRIDDMISKIPDNYKDRILKVANKIIDYKNNTLNEVEKYYELAPKDNKKDFMIWVNNNCRKEIMGYVRCKYLNKQFNVLKNSAGGYKKLKDLGMSESYSALFSNLEV